MNFKVRVSTESGKIKEFHRHGQSRQEVSSALASEGFWILKIEEVKEKDGRRKISLKDRQELTQTLSMLSKSGLSLKDSIKIALTASPRKKLVSVLEDIRKELEAGHSFSKIIENMEDAFPRLYRGLTKVGERTGNLDTVLERLAEYLKNQKDLREKTIGALVYPLFVTSLVFIGSLVVVFVLFPIIIDNLSLLGGDIGEEIIRLTRRFRLNFFVGGGLSALLLLVISILNRMKKFNSKLALKLDTIFLHIPLWGKYQKLRENLNFLFAMEALLGSGVTLEEAIKEASSVVVNHAYKETLLRVRENTMRGFTLSAAFGQEKLIPKDIVLWVEIGEQAGQTAEVFSQLRSSYQANMNKIISRFVNLINPVLILIVGGLVMYFAMTFVLPILTLYGNML